MDIDSYYTYQEIVKQPESWDTALNDILNNKTANLEVFRKRYDQIIFFGCGSSYNLSQSASVFSRYASPQAVSIALPSSELLINPELYIRDNRKYLLVGFSRSGETTESVEVLNKMKGKKNIDLFTFTCNAESKFSELSDNNFVCNNAAEKSIVMTTSFSSMLIALCAIMELAKENKETFNGLKAVAKYLSENMNLIVDFVKDYIEKVDFKSYFVLGSGFNYGLAVEADLKMKEMSQTPSYSYHIHEFSHGPKSLLENNSLCLVLTPKGLKFEKSLKEFAGLGTFMLITGSKPDLMIENEQINKKIQYFLIDNGFNNEMLKSFINIPLFQLMAFFKTLKNNLNPDLPHNLSYTVKI